MLGWVLAVAALALAGQAAERPAITEEQRALITRPSPDRPLRVEDGEKLIYKIGWGWFDVGRAEVTLERTEYAGKAAWLMEMTARTNGFADAFYKVRNTTQAWIAEDFSETLHYEAVQREGSRERDVVVHFDREERSVRYENRINDDRRSPIGVLAGTWDPMGITWFVRSLPLAVGDHYVIPTTNGKEFFLTQVSVVERERRRFRMGRQEAYKLKPNIKDLGGVFEKSDDASITFWFSADERQLPLRMESEVVIGSFWAELVEVTRVDASE